MPSQAIIIVLFIALFAVIAIFSHLREKKRRQAFTAQARQLGLRYYGERTASQLALQYASLELFERGNCGRKGKHVMAGEYQGYTVMTCAYQYTIESGSGKHRSSRTYRRGLAMLYLGLSHAPRLMIRHEGLFDKLGGWFGLDDIDFESDEFSRRYFVKCNNERFAYKLIDPRMMEMLLRYPNFQWELAGGWVAVWREDELDVQETPELIEALIEFARRTPRLVRQEYIHAG
jgi:hypothetical protein